MHLTDTLLDLYVDDALPAAERAPIEAHLADCAACRAEVAALRALHAALATLEPLPMPVDLTPRVLAQVAAPVAPPRLVEWLLAVQIAAVLALVVWAGPLLAGAWRAWGRALPTLERAQAALLWQGLLASMHAEWQRLAAWGEWLAPLPALLSASQWAGLLAAAALLWLLGNRWLLGATPALTLPRRFDDGTL